MPNEWFTSPPAIGDYDPPPPAWARERDLRDAEQPVERADNEPSSYDPPPPPLLRVDLD